jgi:hypothetical protein
VQQIAIHYIECNIWAGMAKMAFTGYCWSAHIEARIAGSNGLENFFLSGE